MLTDPYPINPALSCYQAHMDYATTPVSRRTRVAVHARYYVREVDLGEAFGAGKLTVRKMKDLRRRTVVPEDNRKQANE